MEEKLEVLNAYLKAIAFNALFSMAGFVATMILFAFTDVDNWAVQALLAWLFCATSATILGSRVFD